VSVVIVRGPAALNRPFTLQREALALTPQEADAKV
jgi:hypothetical protein